MTDITENPERYVRENRDRLRRVLRHSNDQMARAWAWALLDKYGEEPEIHDLKREFEAAEKEVADL